MKIIEGKSKHKLLVQVLVVLFLVWCQSTWQLLDQILCCPRTLDMVLNPGTIVNTEREVILLKAQLKATIFFREFSDSIERACLTGCIVSCYKC